MILYGSQTSPFARRIRLLLNENDYEFRKVDIFNTEERKKLLTLSPLLKIPILDIEGKIIWDSRVIFNVLCKMGHHSSLSIEEENILTAINDVSDSLVQKLLASRSQLSFPPGTPLAVSHSDRITNTLNYLEQKIEENYFNQWNFLSMSLFTLIDWILFRNLTDLSTYPKLLNFRESQQNQPRIQLTDPRTK